MAQMSLLNKRLEYSVSNYLCPYINTMKLTPVFLLLLLTCNFCNAQQKADLIISNANVIYVDKGTVVPEQTVIIQQGRIIATGESSIAKQYKATKMVDASGKYLMNGLWDMHMHFGGDTLVDDNEMLLPLYLAMGITTVRDAAGDISLHVLRWRDSINHRQMTGPRIFTSGPKLEGKNSVWPGDLEIENETELQLALDSLKKLKVDFVKITDNTLAPDLYLKGIREARKRGWKVSGHVPATLTLQQASDAGLSSIEHLGHLLRAASKDEAVIAEGRKQGSLNGRAATEQLLAGFDSTVALKNYRNLAANGTAVTPTMIGSYISAYMDKDDHQQDDYLKYIGPELRRTWRARRVEGEDAKAIEARHFQFETTASLIRLLKKAGVTLFAGTDGGYLNSFIYPGLALHQELALLVKYGLTPQEALTASVINGPAFFGLEKEYGSVAKGKVADLLLLDENPLADIHATQKINAVIRDGVYMDRNALDASLKSIEQWVSEKVSKEKMQ